MYHSCRPSQAGQSAATHTAGTVTATSINPCEVPIALPEQSCCRVAALLDTHATDTHKVSKQQWALRTQALACTCPTWVLFCTAMMCCMQQTGPTALGWCSKAATVVSQCHPWPTPAQPQQKPPHIPNTHPTWHTPGRPPHRLYRPCRCLATGAWRLASTHGRAQLPSRSTTPHGKHSLRLHPSNHPTIQPTNQP